MRLDLPSPTAHLPANVQQQAQLYFSLEIISLVWKQLRYPCQAIQWAIALSWLVLPCSGPSARARLCEYEDLRTRLPALQERVGTAMRLVSCSNIAMIA